jgi:hypothetical protein
VARQNYSVTDLNDTCNWTGHTWSQLSPSTSPAARNGAAMAFDPATGQVVLFGGFNGTTSLGDTWRFGL